MTTLTPDPATAPGARYRHTHCSECGRELRAKRDWNRRGRLRWNHAAKCGRRALPPDVTP
jgi:hypothetical protein